MANGFIAGDDVKRITQHGILVQGETYKVLDTNGKYLLFTIDGCTVNALAEGFELVPPALPEVNKPYGWAGENAARLKSNYEEPVKNIDQAFDDRAHEGFDELKNISAEAVEKAKAVEKMLSERQIAEMFKPGAITFSDVEKRDTFFLCNTLGALEVKVSATYRTRFIDDAIAFLKALKEA